jgi:hypothetical protein
MLAQPLQHGGGGGQALNFLHLAAVHETNGARGGGWRGHAVGRGKGRGEAPFSIERSVMASKRYTILLIDVIMPGI